MESEVTHFQRLSRCPTYSVSPAEHGPAPPLRTPTRTALSSLEVFPSLLALTLPTNGPPLSPLTYGCFRQRHGGRTLVPTLQDCDPSCPCFIIITLCEFWMPWLETRVNNSAYSFLPSLQFVCVSHPQLERRIPLVCFGGTGEQQWSE